MKSKKSKKPDTRKETADSRSDSLPEWNDMDAKKKVFQEIMIQILDHPEIGQDYFEHDDKARAAFASKINIPDGIKVIFLRARDSETPGGGSAIIELPDPKAPRPSPDDMLESFLCTYNPW